MIDCLVLSMIISPISWVCEKIFGQIISKQKFITLLQNNADYLQKHETLKFFKAIIHSPLISNEFLLQGGLMRLMIYSAIQLAVAMGVVSYCWFYLQSSPGKMLVGIKIVDEQTFGKVKLKQSFKRSLMCALTMLPFGVLAILFNPKRQAWHDKLASTAVIKK
jgi:hypothetical protein